MQSSSETTNNLYFLSGGGEMGELIRSKDWSHTSLGEPANWPQSLQTTVAMVLNNPFGMYIAWGSEYIQLYNDSFRPILGSIKHPQALGISSSETFGEIRDTIGPLFEGVMNGNPVRFSDFMVPLNRNGYVEECYFDFSYSPIIKTNGKIGGILVTVIETTYKRKSEKALKESEELFRTMADNIPNLAWMANADGWIYWYNKKWHEYTGTTSEQMEGWGWQSVHHPDELPAVMDKWQESIVSGKPFEMVFPLKGAKGEYRQFLTRVLPVHDEEGKLYQWFGSNTDITEQIETEQSLKESEQRFRTIAEATDIMIATADETSNATYFNKAWVDLTGRPMEELLQFGWADLVHDEDRDRYVNIYLDAFKKQNPFTGELRVLNKQGEYNWVLSKGMPRLNPDGSFAGYISSCVDITERKRNEKSLEEKNYELIKINTDLDNFIYTASHDLSAPISNIEGLMDVFAEGHDFNEEQEMLWELMTNSIQRFKATINDLSEVSKVQHSGKDDLQILSFCQILREVQLDISTLIDVYDPIIEGNFKVDEIHYSRKNLRSVIYNLLSNSLKYSSPDRKPKVRFATEKQGNTIILKVADNGLGLRKEEQNKVFGMFERVHHHTKGSGIGLYMIKRMIENAGGKIELESEIGVGSTFTIYFNIE
ncbi:MAG: PAS domain-containing sensor histidine kinase [Cytophagales bacterium]|nr:PAS domain-containing sensor histidine kinase [Cytophaga sp.]